MAVTGIQSINVSGSSVGNLILQTLAASGAFNTSQATQTKLTALQARDTAMSARLSDLSTLKSLLADLSGAAAALRPAPTTLGADITIDKIEGDPTEEFLELDLTDAANLQTGDKIVFTDTDAGITADTTYFINVVNVDANSKDIRLYTTRANALAGGTGNAVDVDDENTPNTTGNQIIPQPESGITSLFDAYNAVQSFLADKTQAGGSLANEPVLSGLGSKLVAAVRPALASTELSPAISTSSSSRELTIDEDVLADKVDATAQTITSLFEGTGGIADNLRTIAASYISTVGTLSRSLDDQSSRLSTQITSLLEKSQQEQSTGYTNIVKIAGAIALTQYRIQFLSSLT